MDREAREEYLVVVQVKDMLGLSGGYSSSTTVTVSLTDVNDNGPTFQHRESLYMTHSAANTGPRTHTQGINERVQSVADCEDIFNIMPKRYLFDHTSPVRVGGCAASALLGCTHLVIQPAAKIKRRQSKNEEGGKGGGKEMGKGDG